MLLVVEECGGCGGGSRRKDCFEVTGTRVKVRDVLEGRNGAGASFGLLVWLSNLFSDDRAVIAVVGELGDWRKVWARE